MNKINFLSVTDVIKLHTTVIKIYGGLEGIRDKKLLESAIAQPKMTIFGQFACKDIFQMAAACCFHIAKNHPFIDGNKRTSLLITLTFLEKNGFRINKKVDLYNFMLDVASSRISKEQIAEFLKNNTFKVE